MTIETATPWTDEDRDILLRSFANRTNNLGTLMRAETADARSMYFDTQFCSFDNRGSQLALQHRMRAGNGLSPAEYADLY